MVHHIFNQNKWVIVNLLRVGRSADSGELGTIKVGVGELDSLDVLLLLDDLVTVGQQGIDAHEWLFEFWWALSGVDQSLAQVLQTGVHDELSDLIIIDSSSESTEEIDGLVREGVDELLDGGLADVVLLEDTSADSNSVLSGWVPVELLHTSITNERSVQGGEIVTGTDDRNSWDLVVVVDTRELNVGWVISNVHQGGVNHLVVDGVLGGTSQSTGTSIEIVDEQGAHLTLADDVRGLSVSLSDELGWLTGVTGLQLTSTHDDRVDSHLLEGQVSLEGLTLTLSSPDSQNEWNLDLWEIHEVLCDVNGQLVKERLGDVETFGSHVVVCLKTSGHVVRRVLDGVVGSTESGGTLELVVDHSSSSVDVHLVVTRTGVLGESGPSVLLLGLGSDDSPGGLSSGDWGSSVIFFGF